MPRCEWLAPDENNEPIETHRTSSARYRISGGREGGCANPRLEELSGSESDSRMQEVE